MSYIILSFTLEKPHTMARSLLELEITNSLTTKVKSRR